MSKLIHGLMFAACAAFAIHGSAFAQVREVTQQPTSQPTTLSLPSTLWDAFAISRSAKVFELDGQSNDLAARGQTRSYCGQATGSRCRAIAVPDNYAVAGILCNDGNGHVGGYLGGSQKGSELVSAWNKAADDNYVASSDLHGSL
jgi:hypothetical protein